MRNYTEITEFILLGPSDNPQLQVVSFIFLLITYMLSITGNLTIITLILWDSHLQISMYIFLRNFSLVEVSFTTVSIPKFLATIIIRDKTTSFNDCKAQVLLLLLFLIFLGIIEFYLLTAMSYNCYIAICKLLHYMTIMNHRFLATVIMRDKKISFNDCMAQLLLLLLLLLIIFIFLGITKFYLLASMSYDRYIAICKLLHYMTIMNHRVCTLLVLASWLTSFLIIFPLLMFFIQLDYCKSNVISRFTCDYFPLLYLSCSDTKFLEILGFSCAVFILLFTLALIILSYTYVFRTILRIPSTTQRTKAFSTSSSHMIVISISYGSCIFMYVIPSAKDRVTLSKGVAVLNISVAPMPNPFIYTLRNQQVKRAFMGMARKTMFFSRK
ncbi:hypothetical protein FD754_021980 [Muntiacus muntjak]|uniref:G-protein coupled receptors family 1 profile domain-containing protein n=1 Tax=Muntiacus muntjak TaxID=9888 RepID=A0A5N3V7A6_MUNMU|nr:hypothetical protein FD754_021980 [Muntiacus muntjak]